LAIFAAATVAAAIERLQFSSAWNSAGTLTSPFYWGDAQRLVDYALAIVRHQTFDNGVPFHPPGWPIVLAGFLSIIGGAGVPVAAVKWLLAAISGLAVGLSTLVAYEIAGAGAMLAVAFLGAFHFGHIVEGTVADTEALYSLWVALAMWCALRWTSSGRPTSFLWAAAAGAVAGAATVTRAEFVAAALVIGAAVVLVRRSKAAVELTLSCVVFAAVLAPTTIWHWRSLAAFNRSHVGRMPGPIPEFAPVTSYGPFNFAMANHENANGGPNRDHPMLELCNEETAGRLDIGQLDLQCPAVYDLYVHGYRIGLAWMASHPMDAAALVGRKLQMAAGFLAFGYFTDDVGAGVDGVRRRVDLLDPSSRALVWIHLALIIGGIAVLRRHPIALLVVVAPLAAFVASTILFYGYVRLGVAYLPAVWVLQGACLGAIFAHGRAPRRRSIVIALGAVAVLVAIELIRTSASRSVSLEGPRTDTGVLIQDETIEIRGGNQAF